MPLLRYAIRSNVGPLWCDEGVPLCEEDDCPHQVTGNEGEDERAAEEGLVIALRA